MAGEADALGRDADEGGDKDERSTAGLFADLAAEIGLLIRQEVALLKAELREKFGRAGRGAVALVVGVALAASGWLVLLAAAVLALTLVLPAWLAALAVGAATVVLGVILIAFGKGRLAASSFVPRRTLDSLREDEAWIRRQFR